MARSRFSKAESVGVAVLLLCIAAPLIFSALRSPAPGASPASGAADSVAIQARIDSAQHRADSIAAARVRRKAERDSARAVRAFRAAPRDRLRDVVSR